MNIEKEPNKQEGPPSLAERGEIPEQVQEVIGWMLFIRHYGGNLGKYGGSSVAKRAAQA